MLCHIVWHRPLHREFLAAGLERYIRDFANLEYTESQSHHEWKLYFNVEAAVFLVVAVYAVWRPMAV
jgi:hypothetical protein